MSDIEGVDQIPNEHGKNRYGLDMAYFRALFNRELNRPLVDYRPDELARVLARAARMADAAVLQEAEFQPARAQGGEVEPVAWKSTGGYYADTLHFSRGAAEEAAARSNEAAENHGDGHWREASVIPLARSPAPAQGDSNTVYWHFEGSEQDNLETLHPSVQVVISAGTLQGLMERVGPTESLLIDHIDLMADEFKRVKALNPSPEIVDLCERALRVTHQNVPVVEQRDRLETEVNRLRAQLASGLEEKQADELEKGGPSNA